MFAIAFDLVVKDVAKHHVKGISVAYAEIGATMADYGFLRVQGGLYVCNNEDLANLMDAMDALAGLIWFPDQSGMSVCFVSINGRTLPSGLNVVGVVHERIPEHSHAMKQ